MPTTARFTRPLLRAAVTSLFLFGLLATRSSASEGAGRCAGSLDVPNSSADMTAAADAIVCLVNVERTNRDVAPLQRDRDLAQAARAHALDMARHDYFSHVSRNGDTLSDRLSRAGYGRPGDGWRAGEDIGWGTGEKATPNALVDAWLDSPGHRRILLSASYREIGVGVAGGAPQRPAGGLPGATYTMDLGTIIKA